jgi:HAE1 family hydrophobic/amphiphilic exporter-1
MSLPALAVKRPVFITSIILLMLFGGLLSIKNLPVSLFPETNIPYIAISTLYPGAGPKEVELSVSNYLEEELSTVEGVKKINAVSRDSLSVVWVEFKTSVNIDSAEQRVRDKVALARSKMSNEIEPSIIERFNPSNQPVITAFVQSNTMSRTQLTTWTDQNLKPLLARIPKVGRIEILGGQKRQIDIKIDPRKIENYRIPLLQIVQNLKGGGTNIPAGSVKNGNDEVGIRVLGQYTTLQDINEKIITFSNSETPVRVKDFGEVIEGSEKLRSKAYYNGVSGVVVQVYRQSGTNIVSVADSIKKVIVNFTQTNKDNNVPQINIVRDSSKMIRDNIFDVFESILIGILLTIIVVFCFLGSFRSTIITAVAIPNSLLGAFIFMNFSGFSINILTLLAMSLCVGLLVDDAIVVRENIFKKMEEGHHPKNAAVMGANEVAMAVMAVTLAVVSMFGPVAFLQGVTGQFFREFGLVVCFAVLVSLYDAMAVAPMLSAYMGRAKQQLHNTKKNILAKFFEFIDGGQTKLERYYEMFLFKSLKRPILTICCVVVLAVALSFSASRLPSGFLPTDESQEFLVRIEMPSGTHLDATEKLALQVDNLLKNKPFIEYTVVTIGNAQQEINKADIFVMLKPSKERARTKPSLLREELRNEFSKYENLPKGAEIRVMQNDISGAGQRPFNLLIQTKSSADLEKVARPVFEKLKSNSALISPDLEIKSGAQEIQIKLHEKESQHLGITPGNAGMELRARIEGLEIGKLSEKGFEYPIKVIAFDSAELWLKQNQPILVPNVNMTPVDLRKAASFTVSQSSAKIERVNRAYSARITADLAGNANLGEIMEFIDETVKASAQGLNDVNVLYEGDAESYEEMAESMSLAFLSGIILLFLVLSSLYESFLLSFLNIITLPFAISGAFLSLWIFGEGVNIFSVIGILLLLGVATKNSILLIDTAQERLKFKAKETESDDGQKIIEAAVRRLRPILMTSLALIAGAIPIAIGLNEASAQRTGMGVAIVGGTLTSTLFTLVLIPSVIMLVVKVQEKLLKLSSKNK